MKNFKDKDGNDISIAQIVQYLTGTDENGMAGSVIDFGLYDISDDKEVKEPLFYMVAAEAVVTKITFMGPFTMLEVDFQDIGIPLMKRVMQAITDYHTYTGEMNRLVVSTITSMDPDSRYVMTLANPIISVRGYSDDYNASSILQLVYATDDVIISECELDISEIKAEVEREQLEQLRMQQVTQQEIDGYQEVIDNGTDIELDGMFKPEFTGLRGTSEKFQKEQGVKISGKQAVKVKSKNTEITEGGGENDLENQM